MAAGHNLCWFAGRVLEHGLTVDPPRRDAMLKRCRIERGATTRPTGAVPIETGRPAPSTPPRGREGGALGAIPANCPVGKPVCYRQDCRHWSNGCAHPRGLRDRGRKRRR